MQKSCDLFNRKNEMINYVILRKITCAQNNKALTNDCDWFTFNFTCANKGNTYRGSEPHLLNSAICAIFCDRVNTVLSSC